IRGRVTDKASGEAVVGVQVSVVGQQIAGLTDADGRYTLPNAPNGGFQLRATRLGYEPMTQDVPAGSDVTTVDLTMTRVATRLAEVVTTVTGAQERLKVGNAIGSVGADSVMRAAPVTNLG